MKITRAKIVLLLCFDFIIGIALASFVPVVYLQNDLLLFCTALLFLILSIISWQKTGGRWFFLFLLFLSLAIWRYSLALPSGSPEKIWFYNGQEREFVARVDNETLYKSGKQKIYLEAESLGRDKVQGKVLVISEAYPEYHYGDILKISGDLQSPEKIDDFSYDRYLARYGIYTVIYYPKIEKIGEGEGNYFFQKILNFKKIIRQTIIAGSREPYAGLIQATLLGGNETINPDLQKLFSSAGISHLIAISGMHISLLAVILLWVLILIGFDRRQAFYLILFLVWLYVAMIGFMPSAARAAVMSSLFLWAIYLGRLSKAANLLALAAVFLLLFNPLLLRDDLGFQLSFLALLGMGIIFPSAQAWVERRNIPEFWGLRDCFLLTLAAQILTTPLIALNFSQVSLVAILANLLVIWTSPFLLIFSGGAIFLSLIFPSLAFIWFLPAEMFFAYLIWVSQILLHLPGAYFNF